MSDYWFASEGRDAVRSYYFQENDRLPQYLTEEVLRRRVQDLPSVKPLFGRLAEAIEQTDDAVRVTIAEEGRPYEKDVLRADYVVGCDGARSMVREYLGIDRGGADFDQRMVLAVFRSRELHEGLKRLPARTTYRVLHPDLNGYWQFFGRIDVGEGWFFHAPVPRESTLQTYDFHGLLQRAAGFSFPVAFDHVGFWDLRIAVASMYRKGRAFIAGDACHTHPPYGGFGLNTGLEDVTNLGWKLAAALQGWGSDRLLDTYTEERQPVFVETGEAMIAGGIEADRRFLERYNPDRDRQEFEQAWKDLSLHGGSRLRSYEPHYEGSSVVLGPPNSRCSIHGKYSFAARAGHHLAPQLLSSGRNVFEELGTGYTLLALGADDRALEAFSRTAQSLNIPLKLIRDTFEGGRTGYESRLVLIRPDQYIAWTGDEPPRGADRLLRQVAGLASG